MNDRDNRHFGDSELVIEGEDRRRVLITPNPRSNSAERKEFRNAVYKAGGLYYNGPDEFIGRHGLPIVDELRETIEVSFCREDSDSVLNCGFVVGFEDVTDTVPGFIAAGCGVLSASAERHSKLNKFQRIQSVPRHKFGVDRTPRGLLEAAK